MENIWRTDPAEQQSFILQKETDKNLKKHFSKEDTHMAKQHMKNMYTTVTNH
jgi:hypothetical protein